MKFFKVKSCKIFFLIFRDLPQNSLIHLHLKGILRIPIDNSRLCYRNKLIVNHLRRIHFYDRTIKNKSGVIFADLLFHNTGYMKNGTFFDIHENILKQVIGSLTVNDNN